jgi:hypothetical protein
MNGICYGTSELRGFNNSAMTTSKISQVDEVSKGLTINSSRCTTNIQMRLIQGSGRQGFLLLATQEPKSPKLSNLWIVISTAHVLLCLDPMIGIWSPYNVLLLWSRFNLTTHIYLHNQSNGCCGSFLCGSTSLQQENCLRLKRIGLWYLLYRTDFLASTHILWIATPPKPCYIEWIIGTHIALLL